MSKRKKIPEFKSEDKEREFWGKEDSTEYFEWKKAQPVAFPGIKPLSMLPDLLQASLRQHKCAQVYLRSVR